MGRVGGLLCTGERDRGPHQEPELGQERAYSGHTRFWWLSSEARLHILSLGVGCKAGGQNLRFTGEPFAACIDMQCTKSILLPINSPGIPRGEKWLQETA